MFANKMLRKILLGATLASSVGLVALMQPQPAFAVSPPPPNRPYDDHACCYTTHNDAYIEAERNLRPNGGSYYAYQIVKLDATHYDVLLWK